jgi:hypothetical protein
VTGRRRFLRSGQARSIARAQTSPPVGHWAALSAGPVGESSWFGSLKRLLVGADMVADRSTSCIVEVLQELMGRKLDVFMTPLCRPVLTSDQAHPMDAAEVSINERIPRFGLIACTISESEMPFAMFIPRMRLQEGVLVVGAGLDLAPAAVENILVRVDEASRSCTA